MFLNNAKVLGLNLSDVDSVFPSRGYYDHSGGVIPFAQHNPNAKIFLQETAGADYYHLTETMERYIGIDKKILELSQCVLLNGDKIIDDELIVFSNVSGKKCWKTC